MNMGGSKSSGSEYSRNGGRIRVGGLVIEDFYAADGLVCHGNMNVHISSNDVNLFSNMYSGLVKPTNRYNGTYQKITQKPAVTTGGRPVRSLYLLTAGQPSSRGYRRDGTLSTSKLCLRLGSRATNLGVGRAFAHGSVESSFDLREYLSNTAPFCGWP